MKRMQSVAEEYKMRRHAGGGKAWVTLVVGSIFLICLVVLGNRQGGGAAIQAAKNESGPAPTPATRDRVIETYGKLPLYFVENRGQLDARVAYYVQGHDKSIYFTSQGVTYALTGGGEAKGEPRVRPVGFRQAAPASQHWAVKLDFVGANQVTPAGEERAAAVVSYFKGPREDWKAGLPTYSSVVYRELWPGIDLRYSGTVNRLKYEFVIQPGASTEAIRLAYRGAQVRLNGEGELEVTTPVGGFRDEKPYAYQEAAGGREEIAATYALGAGQEYGFQVGTYDRSRPLVLDPAVLVYAGYIGGSGTDLGLHGIAVDQFGNAYVTGSTTSTEATFPETVGPDLTSNGGEDAFVAKVNAAGTALVYAGYIGGSSFDRGLGIAVDGSGNAYVTGQTFSNEGAFPETVGPDLTFNGGDYDAFVAKVNAAGTALGYAGYIGGSGDDVGIGIAVDGSGNAYVAGWTFSTEGTFPETVGPDLTFNGGAFDAFVAKVNAAGTALVYAGYIGGSGEDHGAGIAVDGSGNAYVTGSTSSTEATFPVTVGPDLTSNANGGYSDAFVAKISPSIQVAPTASPTQLPAANGAGWNNSDVTVTWNWADNAGGSGIDPANCTTTSLSSGEGASLILNATCKDLAGNTGNASYTVKVDKTNPSIAASAAKADSTPYTFGTWTNQTVTVHFTCSDSGGSGVATCSADQVLSVDGVTSLNGTTTDNAGNSASSSFVLIQVDKTNPAITASATKADSTPYIAGTWTNQTVTVHFTCGDPGGSGVATCSADQVLSADGVTASVNGTATDNAGNSANASFGPVQVDKTNPSLAAPPAVTVNPTGPSGAVVSNATLGTATVSDNLTPSPVVTVSGIPAGNLFPIGTTTLTYTATDLAGNSTMAIQAVTVRSVSTLLAQLMAAVNALPGSTGMRTSLLGHLDNTQKDLANGNMSGACAQMATFILQVSVFQANGSISPAQAASLIADATAARAALGCP